MGRRFGVGHVIVEFDPSVRFRVRGLGFRVYKV